MDDLDRRIWEWLPARQDRRRVTDPAVAAANLGVSPQEAIAAFARLAIGSHIFRNSRGQGWHRGMPCP